MVEANITQFVFKEIQEQIGSCTIQYTQLQQWCNNYNQTFVSTIGLTTTINIIAILLYLFGTKEQLKFIKEFMPTLIGFNIAVLLYILFLMLIGK